MPSPLAPACAPPRWPRAAGALAMALCLLFLGVALALHLLRTDLQWQQATLSLSLHGRGGLLLRIVYVLLAAAIVALAAGLYAQAPPLLFAIAALGLCGVAIGRSYLP